MRKINTDNDMPLSKEHADFVAAMYESTHTKVYRHCLRKTQQSILAEEAMQEVFTVACVKIGEFYSSPNPELWLMMAAHYVSKNILKRLAKESMVTRPLEEDDDISSKPDADNTDIELELAFGDIVKTDDFKMFAKLTLERNTLSEAAGEYNLSEAAFRKRMQRYKKKLRETLEKEK